RGIADDLLLADLYAERVGRKGLGERGQKMFGRDCDHRRREEVDMKSRVARQRGGGANGPAQTMVINQRQDVPLRTDPEEHLRHLEEAVRIATQKLVGYGTLIGQAEDRLLDRKEVLSLRQVCVN